jgi:very-short-patch-repair endonuclease
MVYYNKRLKHIARVLRKNMTESELLLWSRIRRKQLHDRQFYRQKIIGNYVVDFYCPSAKLIVQVDGSQHFAVNGLQADSAQDGYMNRHGFRVLRFPSWEVLSNIDGVVSEIYDFIEQRQETESPVPPLEKGEASEGDPDLPHSRREQMKKHKNEVHFPLS